MKLYSLPSTKMKVLESIWSRDRIKPLSFSIVPSLEDVYKRHDYCQYDAVWVMDVTDIHMKSRMNTWYRCVFKGHSLWDVQAIPLEEADSISEINTRDQLKTAIVKYGDVSPDVAEYILKKIDEACGIAQEEGI